MIFGYNLFLNLELTDQLNWLANKSWGPFVYTTEVLEL